VKRTLIFIHRWLGVALCLVFLLWFPSAIGMMYWDFPSVTAADRLARSPAIDPARVKLSPAEAFATLGRPGSPAQARLVMYDGRAAYRFRSGREEALIYADTGERQGRPSLELMWRLAAAWTGQPAGAATIDELTDLDQWTVQGSYRALAPLWKYSWPDGQQVYMSFVTGDVVQYTTKASRLGAYLGPIPHWLYFTPLRRNQPTWSRVVIWTSGIGTVAAILGLVIGVWMYSPSRRFRIGGVPSSFPYSGQKLWHAVLGLIFGLGAATWAFSGMLSMDPFPMPRSSVPPDVAQALRSRLDLGAFAAHPPGEALARLANLQVKELELAVLAGEPAYLATLAGGDTRIVPLEGRPRPELDHGRLAAILRQAAGSGGVAELRVIDQYDMYYLDRHRERPLPVILAQLNDEGRTRLYVDPRTARIVGSYNSRGWMSRWLYHGLHSLDFPWLYNHRPFWDIVVIVFMLGGSGLCVTSLVLAWRVIGRTLA
jgi:hypothetical protein